MFGEMVLKPIAGYHKRSKPTWYLKHHISSHPGKNLLGTFASAHWEGDASKSLLTFEQTGFEDQRESTTSLGGAT